MEKYNEMVQRELEEEERKDKRQFYDRGEFWILVVVLIVFFFVFGKGCVFVVFG
ncbi:hypothetical protein P4S95_08325 [Aneurinibacillus aneurinilyticus]|nr:hypothetical protein [Aneurinibacillus aneurinilyticus]